MSVFSHRLKQLRLEHEYTQKELADALYVSQNAIYNWENGKREPSLDMIVKIANFFDVPVDYLVEQYTPTQIFNRMASFANASESGEFLKRANSYINKQRALETLIEYFERNDYTENEIEEILRFAEFVRDKREPKDG